MSLLAELSFRRFAGSEKRAGLGGQSVSQNLQDLVLGMGPNTEVGIGSATVNVPTRALLASTPMTAPLALMPNTYAAPQPNWEGIAGNRAKLLAGARQETAAAQAQAQAAKDELSKDTKERVVHGLQDLYGQAKGHVMAHLPAYGAGAALVGGLGLGALMTSGGGRKKKR